VVCCEPEFVGDGIDIIASPTVIVEVLSDATELFDGYRAMPSVIDYLLVAHDRLRVEHDTRGRDDRQAPAFGGRERRAPRTIICLLMIQGSIDRDIIRRIIRAHENEIRGCYNQALRVAVHRSRRSSGSSSCQLRRRCRRRRAPREGLFDRIRKPSTSRRSALRLHKRPRSRLARLRAWSNDQDRLPNAATLPAMVTLDHRKLLAHDPTTTQAFLDCIRGYVRRYFHRASEIHDVSQSAMLELVGKLRRGDEPTPDRTYYWVLNCASNAVRRELTRRRHRVVSYESRLHGKPAANPSEAFEARREIERIDRLLADCSDVARRALEASVHGDTHREIAAELELGPGAVRMTISRVRATLSQRLTAEEKLERLRLLAARAGHGRASLFRARSDSSTNV
jgi:RNA polymerase sigma factor (sigma-70 family)